MILEQALEKIHHLNNYVFLSDVSLPNPDDQTKALLSLDLAMHGQNINLQLVKDTLMKWGAYQETLKEALHKLKSLGVI